METLFDPQGLSYHGSSWNKESDRGFHVERKKRTWGLGLCIGLSSSGRFRGYRYSSQFI